MFRQRIDHSCFMKLVDLPCVEICFRIFLFFKGRFLGLLILRQHRVILRLAGEDAKSDGLPITVTRSGKVIIGEPENE